LISVSRNSVSASAVSIAERWPKSAEIARAKRASFFGDRGAQPLQPVQTLIQRRGGFRPRAFEHGMEGVIQGAVARAFQGLVHGVSSVNLWPKAWAFAVILARAPRLS